MSFCFAHHESTVWCMKSVDGPKVLRESELEKKHKKKQHTVTLQRRKEKDSIYKKRNTGNDKVLRIKSQVIKKK